jgi:pseudooxynicotine oxidase
MSHPESPMTNEKHAERNSRRHFLQAAGAAAVGGGWLSAQAASKADPLPAQPAAKSATQTDFDVIVVGGGFSGVTAARDLSKNGYRTLLLEARNRLGGRTFDTHFGPHHVELGGTWVHWTQPHVWNEVTRYGLEIKETPGSAAEHMVVMVDGKPTEFHVRDKYEELVRGFHVYFEESRLVWERPWDTHFRWRELVERDSTTAAERLARVKLTALQRNVLAAIVEGLAHCPLEQASYVEMLRWFALPVHDVPTMFDSEGKYQLKEGTGALIRRMAADGRAEIRLSTPVKRIERRNDVAIVTPQSGPPISAKAVVLALPPRVLKDLEFEPALSAGKLAASRSGFTPSGIKYYAEVKGDLGKINLMTTAKDRLGLALTYANLPSSTLLAGFAPDARTLDGNDEEDMQNALRTLLPGAEVLACTSYSWGQDPFALGTFSSFAPGQLTRSFDELRRHEGRVFMAGGDLSEGWRGFIDGAIGQGAVVARQVSEFLAGRS